ncbi:MAG: DUF4082 domain-containing protein, partial [Anaerolineae bacterium]|nr:DUF4082 domain-containing protein [Anaerolineae bacterium]
NAVAIVQSAQARGVPVITARQMLEWLDGRNTSSFGSLSWDGSTLSFSISADPGANNLRAMLPIQTEAGAITSINFNGTPITFSTEIIKGIEYAVFDALTGVYQASTTPLPPDTEAPSVTITEPVASAVVSGTVTIRANASDNVAVAGVQFQVDGVNVGAEDTIAPYSINWNSLTVANGTHQLTAIARDAVGNTATASAIPVTVNNIPDTVSPTVISISPVNGQANVPVNSSISVSFSEAMDSATINGTTVQLRDSNNNLVSAAVSYNVSAKTATLTPSSALATATTYSIVVRGGAADPRVKDLAGNALSADFTSSFSTAVPSPYSSIWDGSVTPARASENDPNPVELGVKFQSDIDGYITGIRFYKGGSNTGSHIGNLWDMSGQLLATATFVNETASGWQQVNFATPVAVNANTTYVASYHTEAGYYAVDSNYFSVNGVNNAPLRALANGVEGGNGVYEYGPTQFPSSSFSASNYWVDVVFATEIIPDTESPVVNITNPIDGATIAGAVNINASVTDNVGVVGVQFTLDGVNLGQEDASAPYSVDWNSLSATNGNHQIAAIARDAAGNTSTSAVINVTVDNLVDTTPPTIT